MPSQQIHNGDVCYPPVLSEFSGTSAPLALTIVGNLELLNNKPLALFCSRRCPDELILKTYDLAQQWREAGDGRRDAEKGRRGATANDGLE